MTPFVEINIWFLQNCTTRSFHSIFSQIQKLQPNGCDLEGSWTKLNPSTLYRYRWGDPFVQTKPLLLASSRDAFASGDQGDGRPVLAFLDKERVDESHNANLPLIIITIIAKQFISRVLVDEKSYCKWIYLEVISKLGLRHQDLKPCKDQSLLAFSDSSSRSCI